MPLVQELNGVLHLHNMIILVNMTTKEQYLLLEKRMLTTKEIASLQQQGR